MFSKPNNDDLSNHAWALLAVDSFREATDKFLSLALNLPEDMSNSALEYADVLDSHALQIERALQSSGKRSRKVISEYRKFYSDNVLGAIQGFYFFLESKLA